MRPELTDSRDLEPASRAGVLILPVVQLVLIVAGCVYLVTQLLNLDANACLGVPPVTPGWRFVAAAAIGLTAGRYLGGLHFFSAHPSAPQTDRDPASVLLGYGALALIFFALVFIFVYEAVGVYQPLGGYEPITYYVRCSIWLDNALAGGVHAMAILALIGFLFGQWLWSWHPPRVRRRDGTHRSNGRSEELQAVNPRTEAGAHAE